MFSKFAVNNTNLLSFEEEQESGSKFRPFFVPFIFTIVFKKQVKFNRCNDYIKPHFMALPTDTITILKI